jgi:hypothetical protein
MIQYCSSWNKGQHSWIRKTPQNTALQETWDKSWTQNTNIAVLKEISTIWIYTNIAEMATGLLHLLGGSVAKGDMNNFMVRVWKMWRLKLWTSCEVFKELTVQIVMGLGHDTIGNDVPEEHAVAVSWVEVITSRPNLGGEFESFQDRHRISFGRESHGTYNQESLCWRGPATTQHSLKRSTLAVDASCSSKCRYPSTWTQVVTSENTKFTTNFHAHIKFTHATLSEQGNNM